VGKWDGGGGTNNKVMEKKKKKLLLGSVALIQSAKVFSFLFFPLFVVVGVHFVFLFILSP
jgi:hypothetical protein